jgi:hypothetical protein
MKKANKLPFIKTEKHTEEIISLQIRKLHSQRTKRPKDLKINSPRFIRFESNEHGIKPSFKLKISVKVMEHPQNVYVDHIPKNFFFDKSMYYIKKRKGAQPLVH